LGGDLVHFRFTLAGPLRLRSRGLLLLVDCLARGVLANDADCAGDVADLVATLVRHEPQRADKETVAESVRAGKAQAVFEAERIAILECSNSNPAITAR
jgi:hypothetical protein